MMECLVLFDSAVMAVCCMFILVCLLFICYFMFVGFSFRMVTGVVLGCLDLGGLRFGSVLLFLLGLRFWCVMGGFVWLFGVIVVWGLGLTCDQGLVLFIVWVVWVLFWLIVILVLLDCCGGLLVMLVGL